MIKDDLACWSSEGWELVTDNCSDDSKKYRMRYIRYLKYSKLFADAKFTGANIAIERRDVSDTLAGQQMQHDNLQCIGRKVRVEEIIKKQVEALDILDGRYKQEKFDGQLNTDYHNAAEIQRINNILYSKDTPPLWIDTMKYIIIDGGSRKTRSLMVSTVLYRLVMYNINRLPYGSQSEWSAVRKDWVELLTNIEEDRKTFVDFNKIDTENSVIYTPVLCLQEVRDTTLLTPAVIDVLDSVLSRRIDKVGGGVNIISLSSSISRGANYGNIMGQILKTDKVPNNPTSVCMRIQLTPAKDMLETETTGDEI